MKIENTLRDEIASKLNTAQELVSLLEELRDSTQATHDSHSERWQEGDKGTDMQQDIDELDSNLISELIDIIQRVDSFFEAND